MPSIDVTISGEFSNSYVDVAFADDYWTNHFSTVKAAQWTALTSAQKTTVLVAACRVLESARFTLGSSYSDYELLYDRRSHLILNRAVDQLPVKYSYYQKLQFPRNLDIQYTGTPGDIGTAYIPEDVQEAQCEQALYLINFDDTAVANRLQGITLEKVGVGRDQITTTQEYAVTGSMFAPLAMELLRAYFIKGGRTRRS